MTWRRTALALMAATALALGGCDDDGGMDDAGVDGGGDAGPEAMLTGVSISPTMVTLEVGASQQLTVTGMFDDGSDSNVTSMATFASGDDAIATVSGGQVAAVALGTTTITATVDGFDPLTVDVTVEEPPPTDPTLPMAVDDFFQGRAGFSDAGAPLYTEDEMCPERAGGEAGVCHRFVWDGTGGAFTGAIWIDGTGFGDATPVDVEMGGTEVTFFAWGETGGEVIEFGAGITTNDGGGGADGSQTRRNLTLTTTPTEYTVRLGPLVGYSDVVAAFVWAADNTLNPSGATFYVDDITWIAGTTPTTPDLPMPVDVFFPGRAAFSSAGGAPLHTEDNLCPMRGAADAVGDCHHINYTGSGGDFSGQFWIQGSSFDDNTSVAVEAGATEVRFIAWGAAGGEVIDVGAGIMDDDGAEDRRRITLSTTPTEYIVPLANLQGYTEVFGAFIFGSGGEAAEYYIDDIEWVMGTSLTPIALPMTVDDNYMNRSAFGDGGAPLHTETAGCPMRAGGMNGTCHTFDWNGMGGAFTGTFWTIGEAFTNLESRSVAPGATVVRFWAWGAAGGEVIEFGAGGDFGDVGQDRLAITLTTTPTEYTVLLTNNASYNNVFAPFIWAANNGANPSGFTFYVDDIQWAEVAIPRDLRPHPEDRVIAYNGGAPALRPDAVGGSNVGDAEGASVYVIPFQLPPIPSSGTFTNANLTVNIIAVAGTGSATMLNADLYGLPFRAASGVSAGDVVQTSMFYSSATVDPGATLLQDNFLTGTTPGGDTATSTDAAGDTAIVNYLNAQVTAGAVAGDFVYLRLTPDAAAPIPAGYTWVVGAAVDTMAPANRPTLTVQ